MHRAQHDAVSRSRVRVCAVLTALSLLTGLTLVLAARASAGVGVDAGAGAGAAAGAGASAAPGVSAADQWRWPLDEAASVSRGFAPPTSRYGSGHRGADLPGATGLPVLAAAGGVVTYAGRLAGRGVVVVSQGELRTTYEPVTSSVALGSQVSSGDELGRLEPGHSGCPVEACLHWGLRRGEDYLDPVALVQRRPMRLLPLGLGPGGPAVGGEAGLAGSRGAADPGAAGRTASHGSGAGGPTAVERSRWSAPPGPGAVAGTVVMGTAASALAGGMSRRRGRVD